MKKLVKSLLIGFALITPLVLSQSTVYNYFAPGGALSGTAILQTVNLASGTYISGNLPVGNLGGGTNADASHYWRGDGTWQIPPGATLANPTGTVGLSAVNGSASTVMRSDAAPALSQAIAPTWTGTHTFTPSSGNGIIVNAQPSQWGEVIYSATSGTEYGLLIDAGVGATDTPFDINNRADSAELFRVYGNAGVTVGGVSNLGLGTINAAGNIYSANGTLIPNVASSPTWTGTHTFANPSNVSLIADGASNFWTEEILGANVTGKSLGLLVESGTNSSDYAAAFNNRAATVNLAIIRGDGGMLLGSNGITDEGLGTINVTGGYYVNGVQVVSGNVTHGSNANGYWRKSASDGFIEQWGTITVGPTGGGTVTFPIAFTSTASLNCQLTAEIVAGFTGCGPPTSLTTIDVFESNGSDPVFWHVSGY